MADESYWQRDAGWSDRWPDTAIPGTVDFAVLGGGLAGFATAIRLRERDPSAVIVVLEAERVGFGASGRSAGFLSPLAAPVWLLGAERSPDQAWAAARINAEVHASARWIADRALDCELAPANLCLAADSRLSDCALAELTRAVEHVGLAHRLSSSRARRDHLSLEMTAYTVQPYKLVRGLAEHAARIGVIVRERARVRAVERASEGARVRIDSGDQLVARRVIACTNAYTRSLGIDNRVRAAVVHSFMTATAPLEPSTVQALARDGDFTVEVNTAQAYHRMHGARLVYGGIDKLTAPAGSDFAVPTSVRTRLARCMNASFPGVGELVAAEAWSGRFHATPTGLPIIRASATNPAVILNVGYGGTGVALALACAPLAAAVASGDDRTTDDARLLSIIRDTRISARDAMRAIGRIAGRFAQPWRRQR